MLKLNLKQQLLNLAGQPLTDGDKEEVQLGKILANAVVSVETPSEPVKNFILSQKLYQGDEITLTAEELEYIKQQVRDVKHVGGMVFPTIYRGQILNLLDKLDKEDEQGQTEQNKTEEKKGEKAKK